MSDKAIDSHADTTDCCIQAGRQKGSNEEGSFFRRDLSGVHCFVDLRAKTVGSQRISPALRPKFRPLSESRLVASAKRSESLCEPPPPVFWCEEGDPFRAINLVFARAF